jgi:hypothetical protein
MYLQQLDGLDLPNIHWALVDPSKCQLTSQLQSLLGKLPGRIRHRINPDDLASAPAACRNETCDHVVMPRATSR